MRPDRRQRRGEGVLEGKRNVGKGKKKKKNRKRKTEITKQKTEKGLSKSLRISTVLFGGGN